MTSNEIKRSINKTYCSVPQCFTEGTKNPTISFHRFPVHLIQRLKWKYATRIGKQITSRMCVCSKHFKTNDYFYNGMNVKRKRLKRTAVPSLNLPVTATEILENVPEMMQNVKVRNIVSDSRNQLINARKHLTDSDISTPFEEEKEETSKTKPDIVYLSVDVRNGVDQSSNEVEQYSENVSVDFESKDLDISEEALQSDITLDSNDEISNISPEMAVDSDNTTENFEPINAEVLKQKLDEMTARYAETQRELKLYQERCKKYQKQITALEKVINNFKQITSVSDDS